MSRRRPGAENPAPRSADAGLALDAGTVLAQDAAHLRSGGALGEARDQVSKLVPLAPPAEEADRVIDDARVDFVLAHATRGGGGLTRRGGASR